MRSSLRVIKIGGKVIEQEEDLSSFLKKFSKLSEPKILVHGGGALVTTLSQKLGIATEMVDGRRITSKETLDVIIMTCGGLVNRNIVAKLQGLGINSVGLSGADFNLIEANKRKAKPLDYGWVGDIKSINVSWLIQLIKAGITPVISPLTHDGNGNLLNTNADAIASSVASALSAYFETHLQLCFEQDGVIVNEKVVNALSSDEQIRLIQEEVITDGMIPKTNLGFEALKQGVSYVRIQNFNAVDKTGAGTNLLLC